MVAILVALILVPGLVLGHVGMIAVDFVGTIALQDVKMHVTIPVSRVVKDIVFKVAQTDALIWPGIKIRNQVY